MSFGFGSSFGANSAPFGQSTQSPFGQSTSAFGQAATPFGAASSAGIFGQSQPAFGAAPPAFGTGAPAFGASQPAFGASQPAFGAAAAPAFGASASGFGASAPAFGTGAPAFGASQPAFGASQPAFGAAAAPAFGASASGFGASAPAFGTGAPAFGASQPAFGASQPAFGASQPAFGAAAAPAFGASASGFGASAPAFGTGAPAFGTSQPAFGAAAAPAFGASQPAFGAAASPAFGSTSPTTSFGFGGTSAPSLFGGTAQQTTGSFFGQQQPAAGTPSAFGVPTANRGSRISPWRKTQETDTSSTGTRSTVYYNSISFMPEYASKSVEELRWEDYQDNVKGGTSTASPTAPAAGQPQFGAVGASSPSFGGFTSQPAAPFGAQPSSGLAFGAASTSAQSTGFFGAPASSASAFGASSPFQAASAPTPTAASAPSFGFGFGGTSGTSMPSFSAPSSTPSPLFGASSTPSFFGSASAAASKPAFGFGGAAAPLPSPSPTPLPAFGGFSTGTSLFSSTPASSAGLFGTTPFSFTQAPATTPSFGFGGTTGTGGSSSPAPAFGGFGGFGASAPASQQAPFQFSFPSTSTPAAGAQSQPQSQMGLTPTQTPALTGPYGALPEPPKVTPLPEYKVGLTQQQPRLLAPPSSGPPKPVSLITPRSLTPLRGGKLRPRAGAPPPSPSPLSLSLSLSASRTAARATTNSPADFFAAAAAGLTPSPFSSPQPSSSIFIPRENPRHLFIRRELPSTGGATATATATATANVPLTQTPTRALTPRDMGNGVTDKSNGITTPFTLAPLFKGESGMAGKTITPGLSLPRSGGFRLSKTPTDEEISTLLPKLNGQNAEDYYVEPSLTQLAAMARENLESLSHVANFTVGRHGVGSVRWLDPVDVRGIDLAAVVNLARGSVEVYFDDDNKPEVGSGLNCPAEVTLLKVFKTDRATGAPTQDPEAVDRFVRKLKKVAAEQKARFLSYDGTTGTWKFQVEHFSRYGLDVSDDDDDGGGGEGEETQKRVKEGKGKTGKGVRISAEGTGTENLSEMEAGEEMQRQMENAEIILQSGFDQDFEEGGDGEDDLATAPRVDAKDGEVPVVAHDNTRRGFLARARPPKSLTIELGEAVGSDLLSSPLFVGLNEREGGIGFGVGVGVDTEGGTLEGQHAGREAEQAEQTRMQLPILPPLAPVRSAPPGLHAPPALPRHALGLEPKLSRCLPDSGAFLGTSTRTGWAVGGIHASVISSVTSSSVLALRHTSCLVPSPSQQVDGLGAAAAALLRSRLRNQLAIHYAFSYPDEMTPFSNSAPRWRVRLSRFSIERSQQQPKDPKHPASLQTFVESFVGLTSDEEKEEANKEIDGAAANLIQKRPYKMDRVIQAHRRDTWKLLDALFSAVPAEQSSQVVNGIENEDEDSQNQEILIQMQRRASLELWLQSCLHIPSRRSFGELGEPDPEELRVLWLLVHGKHEAACAAAAEAGNVRLATLVAATTTATAVSPCAWKDTPTSRSASCFGELIGEQLMVWRDAGFESFIDKPLYLVYSLLAGNVNHVISELPVPLDWRAALGCALWYGPAIPGSASCYSHNNHNSGWIGVEDAVKAYSFAVEDEVAPPPLPPALTKETDVGAERGAPSSSAYDASYELLRLFCAHTQGDVEAVAEFADRLLLPASTSPADALDYSFSWLLMTALFSLGILMNSDDGDDTRCNEMSESHHDSSGGKNLIVAKTHMGFIDQLEALGGLTPWTVYVAMHIANDFTRERVVKELLTRHCPEWFNDERTMSFFLDSLRIPMAWVAEARAVWARHCGDPIQELAEYLAGEFWGEAHRVLCLTVGPRWLLTGNPSDLGNLSDALTELEPRAAEIDGFHGFWPWRAGGGVFAGYLALREEAEWTVEDRRVACLELKERLDAAWNRMQVSTGPAGPWGGGLDHFPQDRDTLEKGNATLCAALTVISKDLARWMVDFGEDEELLSSALSLGRHLDAWSLVSEFSIIQTAALNMMKSKGNLMAIETL